MDAHSADASCFLSSHVTGCISYHTICFWLGLSLHSGNGRLCWSRAGLEIVSVLVCKYLISDHVVTAEMEWEVQNSLWELFHISDLYLLYFTTFLI